VTPYRLGSSLRCRPPEETLAIAQAQQARLGITRVTDVTRMDRLGLPVAVSVRPRGRALCVHAGKGTRALDARVGALMEAVEYACAEPQCDRTAPRTMRLGDLAEHWAGRLRLLDLAPRTGPAPSPDRLVDVLPCEDLGGGPSTWLPDELVHVPSASRHGDLLCGWSTNGLASGNSATEATLHGLLEVLERDALAMNTPRDASRRIAADELPAPFDVLAARWAEAGVALAVRLVPNEFGLPCFAATLHEGGGAPVDLAGGYGLHLDPHIALARAVCEAAQSRLSHIHGGRDDVTHFFDHVGDPLRRPRDVRETPAWRRAFDDANPAHWTDVPRVESDGLALDEVLAALLGRLGALGFPRVLRHCFDAGLQELHVVKVIVPRCQEIDREGRRLGQRLYEKVLAHA